MRLISLHLRNFRQYADTLLSFQPGVTAIVGPNGAGKTTLLEAISWSLYGSPAIRGSNDSLKRANSPARQPVEATLEFALGSHRYRIFRRPDRAELFVDGSPSPAHSGLQPVSEAVRKLLGMDYRAFFTSYFTGQKELAFLAGMGKQERATAVGRMLGYDRLSRAREKSNQDRLALDREIAGLEKGMGDAQEIASARKEADDRLQNAQKEAAAAAKRLKKAQAALETLAPKYELTTERKARFDDLQRQMALTDRDRTGADAEIRNVRKELARLDGLEKELREIIPQVEEYRRAEREFDAMRPLIRYEKERQGLLGQIRTLQSDIRTLEAESGGSGEAESGGSGEAESDLASIGEQLAEAETSRKEADDRLCDAREEWSTRRAELSVERKGLETQVVDLEHRSSRVRTLGREGDCPTCARPLGEDIDTVLAHFGEEVARLQQRIAEVRETYRKLGDEPSGAAELRALIGEREREIKGLQARRDAASARLQAVRKAERDLVEKSRALSVAEDRLAAIPSGFDQAKYEELAEIAMRLKPVSKRAVEIENELTRRAEWSKRLLEAEHRWAELDERWAEDEKKLTKLKFSPEAHARIVQDYEDAAAEDRNAERAHAAAQTDLAGAEGQARSAREREEEYRRKLELLREKQTQRLYLRTLTEALEGLRLELNARVRPELEAVASDLLADLTDGRYAVLELTEQYEPFIVEEGERKPVISGGEEDVTQLCLRLAISRMIADRSGQPLSLLVLDEIFGSLDASRRDNVVTLLQNLKGIFEQIILITHIESIHDVVDQCLWVSFDPATRSSRVEESRDSLPLSLDEVGDVSEAARLS